MKSLIAFTFLIGLVSAQADPQLSSWLATDSSKYARIFKTTADETAGTKSTTWSQGSGTQTNPVYAGVHEVNYSANWVYIRTSGLAGHVMGPWYLNAAKTTLFPNYPSNTSSVHRFPRTPSIPGSKTLTGLGATGRMVNGVSMFDSRDAFSYVNANATDATPVNGLTGDGVWNRDGYHNEGVTFDPALAHQAGNNYHYHAQPIGLRYQLGDHVDYNAATNRYTESASAVTQHSPILAWANDGLPVYGPYGYSDPTNASSGVRRMISGFVLRDGSNGTTAITTRTSLPAWASRIQTVTFKNGPDVGTNYLLGHYIEDFEYRGDLGQTQTTGSTIRDFDLNEQNVRFCVTPEFPSGTWAYFTPINADGTPQFPYTTGRQFYGNPSGGSTTTTVMNADTPLTQQFIGGANSPLTISTPAVSGTNVTLTWSAVEGGTYSVEASTNQSAWTTKTSGLVSTSGSASSAFTALGTAATEYGRVSRTALATYDTAGQTAATTAQSTTTTYTLGGNASPTISAIAAQSTAQNTATSAIAFTVGDQETAVASLTVSGSSSNTTLVPNGNLVFGGSGANRTLTITPATGQTGTSTITVNVNDGTSTTGTTFTLTVTGGSTVVTIGSIGKTPATPTSSDAVIMTSSIAPSSGASITQAQLTYNTGSGTTTVFNETMGTAAATAWTGAGTVYPWTITFGGPPQSPFAQSAASNHTASGQGNQFGMEITANAPPITGSTMTTTTAINATGSSATVTFWVATSGLSGTQGWDFQTTTDGTTFTTRTSELTGSNHAYQQYSYTLSAAERVSTLKLRFRFAGPGANNVPKVYLDDIAVTVGGAASPVTVNMFDDGTHGDGSAGDGVYGATIPAQVASTTVTYSISATDSAAKTATSATQSYTVVAAAPVLAVTPSTGFTTSGNAGGSFSPASATFTLTNTGTGSMSWTAAKTAAWLTLDATGGTLAAGANTTVTASINAAGNALASGAYTDTINFTNSTNGSGNASRSVSLTVNATVAPAAPSLAALPTYSQGSSKTISWSAVSGATSYTLQISSMADFSSVLSSQTLTGTSTSFSNLANGVTYYYRLYASNNIGASAASNVVSSTQDTSVPTVAITSPASGTSTATNTITVSGTSFDGLSGISKVTVNGVTATTSDGFATWSVSTPLGFGSNGITAVAYDVAGNTTTTSPITVTLTAAQTYNPLIIPEVITGTAFNLNLHKTTKQFLTGAATNTYAYNNMLFWGPTLIMNKGDWVQVNLTNNLTDTTTTHWHGFHIPAIMDGGPHQTIPAGTTWKPSFKVDNNAGTYWYHPHLHEFTQEQLSYGAGGLIIIKDPEEAALNLPRTYGVDDIPLALTSRRFTNNQIVTTGSEYGDSMVVNGVLNAQVSLPKQYVRLRILNAEMERSYNLGVTTSAGADRTFYQIATDGGLVNAPVALTRLVLAVGERAEILLDLTGDTVGTSFDVKAYNSGQANDFPGGEPATTGQFGSALNNTTFNILHVNVVAATANPVTTRPTTLKTNTFWTDTDVTRNRTLTITNGFPGTGLPFSFDNLVYSPTFINQTLNLNAVEKWTITNTSGFSHSFHIHDIQFNLMTRTGGNNAGIKAYEQGWKDVLFIGQNQTVTFIAKFDGFASNTNPFMYHCHFPSHEDDGLMGQFVVVNNAVEDLAIASATRRGSESLVTLEFKSTPGTTYTLQYSADLTTGSWIDVGSVTSDGTTATFNETDPTRLGQARGFYRVSIPTIP